MVLKLLDKNNQPDEEYKKSLQQNIVHYNKSGLLHRTDGPARVYSFDDYKTISFYNNGLLHNEKGPAIIEYSANKLYSMTYIINGEYRRKQHLPTKIYFSKGKKKIEMYCAGLYSIGTYIHRENGPAVISYNESEEIISRHYYINNINVSFDEHFAQMNIFDKINLLYAKSK
jgi:hypothetical protein